MNVPWLEQEMAALRTAHEAGRMPHGLLIHEAPGAAGEWLASWTARMVLGTEKEAHPDWLRVQLVDESKQIRIEQIRELGAELSLTSHQGGFKVGVISPADLLNRFAANALLKTLEEPPPRTVLILVVTQPSRLPATILSRCQRIRIGAPERSQSVAWLEATRGKGNWNAVLDVVGEAPMLAAQADPQTVVQIGTEVRRGLEDAVAGRADPVATADRWSRAELPLRLRCFENWLTERIRTQSESSAFLTEVGAVTYLQPPQTVLNIRGLFELLDGVRDLESALDTPINRGLALETLLRRLER